jgi:hypothetical protein
MDDKKQYQVQSACVVVPAITSDGEQLHTLFTGAVFQANPQHPRIVHNVDSGYIAELGAKATPGVDGAGVAVVDNKRPDGTEVGAPVELNDPGVVNEAAQVRAAAAAKLPEDGSAPDGRAAQPVWVEYLAKRGYDYAELVKQDKPELMKLAKQS